MFRRSVLTALTLLPSVRAGARQGPLPVVASFSILADIVRQVGGAAVSVTSLVPPDGDAHSYEPKPSDLRALADARLLAVNGLGLEGWMDRLVSSAGYAGPVVTASDGVAVRRLNVREVDPHAWQDPRDGAIYARNAAAALAAADPPQADAFRAAGREYAARIMQTDAWIEATLSAIPAAKRTIVTSHDAFGYYGARYGVTVLAAQGVDDAGEPSARDVARLADQVRRAGVRAVFLENMTNPDLIRALARDAGVVAGPPVYSDALSPPDGPAATYVDMLRHNTTLFAEAMSRN